MESKIKEFIKKLGISPELIGYGYMVSTLSEMCAKDTTSKVGYTKLYSQIGEIYGVAGASIERMINVAIKRVFENPESLEIARRELKFPFFDDKCTTSQFLALCAEKLMED